MNVFKSMFEAWKKSLRYADPKFMDLLIQHHDKAETLIEILKKENKTLKDAIADEEMNHFQTQLKLRGAKQDLADRDQEIHRLRIREADREADIKHLQKQLQDHIVDTNKKAEEDLSQRIAEIMKIPPGYLQPLEDEDVEGERNERIEAARKRLEDRHTKTQEEIALIALNLLALQHELESSNKEPSKPIKINKETQSFINDVLNGAELDKKHYQEKAEKFNEFIANSDTNKKVEEPSAEDKWKGFVPVTTFDGRGCNTQCPGYTYSHPHRCIRFRRDLMNHEQNRSIACIKDYGLNPGEVNS